MWLLHGPIFEQQSLGEKAITREVVSKYYLWKRTDDFKEWWRQQKTMKRRKTKKEAERLRQWADESDSDTDAFLGYHNRHCELCATGGSLLCCDGCPRAYHISCAQPPITKLRKDEDWFCSHCQEEFGGSKPKLTSSDQSEHCMTYAIPPGLQRPLTESMTDASSYEEDDEQESYSGDETVGSESSAESDNSDNASKCPRPNELSLNSGSLTDNESDSTAARIPSTSPANDNIGSNKPELTSGPVARSPAAKRKSDGADACIPSEPSSAAPIKHSVEASPVGAMRALPVQLERPGSGRKRHRKMLAPRHIPPSRFDSY